MEHFQDLEDALKVYLEPLQVEKCKEAFGVAFEAHHGQMRRSGEPYITHPVSAALILASMRLDYQTIMATLLHDVVEDTSVSLHEIEDRFGAEVAALVDGVTKLTQIKFESKAEAQAENFRKMVLAMVKDIRVIIVKLADRLHNMSTLTTLPYEKRKRIANETLEIYAPIANRLGMHAIYVALEDLGFQALHPIRYRVLKSAVEKSRGHRQEITQKILKEMTQALDKRSVPYSQVSWRQKHLYSIYRKMRHKRASFNEITDVFAFRVITPDEDACYRALGALHATFRPMPQRFKDYIAIPKFNGYQSLHTILFGPYAVPLEVQIRTKEMDKIADNGLAAHWVYKHAGLELNPAQSKAREWIQNLLEMQNTAGNSLEFIENVKIDLYPDEVYVFTPKGDIMELPKGATPVDFAYMVHSAVGNSCIAAKVNRRLAPLSLPLSNGQTVEIMTSPGATPNPGWLNFVVTGKAKSNIRHHLKTQQKEASVSLGQRLLTQALAELNTKFKDIGEKTLNDLAELLHYKNTEELFFALGVGNALPKVIARRLLNTPDTLDLELSSAKPLAIKGTEGMVLQFAECCQPIPGDNIVGQFQQGRGILVHVTDCRAIKMSKSNQEQVVSLRWDDKVKGEFWIDLTVEVTNKKGVLASLATALSEADSNIGNISVDPKDGRHNAVTFSIGVKNRAHLAQVMKRLRANPFVMRLYRKKQGD